MKVLVAAASRHESTREIAAVIGATLGEALRRSDPEAVVEVRDADEVTSVAGYDAAVLGSAVYLGHWLDAAREMVASNMDALLAMPVWLFSSGPIGDPPCPNEDAMDVASLSDAVHARGHRTFPGRLDRYGLSLGEEAVAVRAPEGDFRDWAAIRSWARELSQALTDERIRT